jgi:tetratricopeptide (TPR) repeat protein
MEALRQMPEGLDDQYTPVRVYLSLVQALLAAGRTEEAKAQLTQVTKLKPTRAEDHYLLAQVFANLGHMDPALTSYAEAMKRDQRVDISAGLHHLLAQACLQKRQFHEALGHEERALALAQAQGDTKSVPVLQQAVEYCRQLEQAAK